MVAGGWNSDWKAICCGTNRSEGHWGRAGAVGRADCHPKEGGGEVPLPSFKRKPPPHPGEVEAVHACKSTPPPFFMPNEQLMFGPYFFDWVLSFEVQDLV